MGGFFKAAGGEGVELAVKSDGWTESGHQYHSDRDQPISYSQAKTASNMNKTISDGGITVDYQSLYFQSIIE